MEESTILKEIKSKCHPIERTNFFSKLFFCWLPPYLLQGLKNGITENDMYSTIEKHKSKFLGEKLEAAWNQQLQKRKPSLLLALFMVFKFELLFFGVFNAFTELLKIAQPLLISKLVSYFNVETNVKREEIYMYATLLILTTFAQVISVHHNQLQVMALGMKIRIAACAVIYRKALKLSKTALAETTIGQMVNLLSNDVGRFDFTAQHIHYLWLSPFATTVCMILLYRDLGVTGLTGSFFLISFVPIQVYMARLTSKFRLKTALKTDERVRLMTEIISGIQVIKMYTWEKPFAKLVEVLREKEINQIRNNSTVKALTLTLNITLTKGAVLLCILSYVLSGNVLTAAYAYTITSFYTYLRLLLTLQFPQAMTQFAETKVSVSRIQKFLLFEELESKYISNIQQNGFITKKDQHKPDIIDVKEIGVKLKNVSVRWTNKAPDDTIHNINFEARTDQLIALVGPVGGGKSTLLQVILKELKPVEGTVRVSESISYASQEPWVFAGSIRQNILFGETYKEKKYREVIKVCALERDINLFPHGDRTVIGERGSSLSGGQRARINLARAIYKDADIYLLDDPLSAVDAHVGKELFNRCICDYLRNKCVILVTHQLQYLHKANFIYLLQGGQIAASGTFEKLMDGDSAFIKLLAAAIHFEQIDNDKRYSRAESTYSLNDDHEFIDKQKEKICSGGISWRVYKNYLSAGGHWCKTTALILSFIVTQGFVTLSDVFLTTWVNVEQWRLQSKVILNQTFPNSYINFTLESKHNTSFWSDFLAQYSPLVIYSLVVVVTVVLAITRSISAFRYFLTASTKIHNFMFGKLVFSQMSFFNANPSGRILNRFSKDMGIVDEILPMTISDSVWVGLTVIATTMVIGAMNPWILVPTSVILLIFYYIRKLFLVSSRDIKRVEAVTRSPIFTHLAASLQGLTTIRAFKAEKIITQEFDHFQDAYTSAYFMFLSANRGFGFWLDLHCALYIGFVVVSVLFIQTESFGGNVGLCLTQAITLSGMFQWVMREWSELENQMTSVERTQEYTDLPTEPQEGRNNPPPNWPNSGKIEFKNMSLKYSEEAPCVLRKINLEVRPGEKIGVVGRTGAGKSSLIQALFRLSLIEGNIFIDDIDTKSIELYQLRSKVSIIPQEPVLFSGTLRKNLDPLDEFSDDILWNALEEVEMKKAVNELKNNLCGMIAEGGSNYSVGQRQLLCLARAIIRNNKILVLDEATANVDPLTDAIIQNTIKQRFSDRTVITIAHRLNTIMDSDKVLVMDAGQAAEFDHPYILLQNKNSLFFNLVKETGSSMAAYLYKIAKEHFARKYRNSITDST